MQDTITRTTRTTIPSAERFWKFVTPGPFTDCWEWMGALRNGYGVLNVAYKVVYAHRFSYELHFGPLEDGDNILHKCDNRKCCNPYHLFAGTKGDNVRDMYAKGRGKGGAKKGRKAFSLTEEQVREIRHLAANGLRYPALAKQFGISISAISMIVTHKRWSHVE